MPLFRPSWLSLRHLWPAKKAPAGARAMRYERFGGILQMGDPPVLMFVDKDYMRSLGYEESPLWDEPESPLLSAPLEVHYTVTHQCQAGCTGCYVNAQRRVEDELSFEQACKALDVLADAGVFHVALGGGESLELPWIIDLAHHARKQGLIPNLTTNGFLLTPELARQCRVFGQINISMDGVGPVYRRVRGIDGFARAERGLRLLRDAGCAFGINTVLTRPSLDHLPQLVAYARQRGVNQIELLRFKPAGRGGEVFDDMALSAGQSRRLYPLLQTLMKQHGVNLRVDCSFVPMLFAHGPNAAQAGFFQIAGCHGANQLLSVGPDGRVGACSFAEPTDLSVFDLPHWWRAEGLFSAFRAWEAPQDSTCAACEYLALCNGGCRAVTRHLTGDDKQGDPGCPLRQ